MNAKYSFINQSDEAYLMVIFRAKNLVDLDTLDYGRQAAMAPPRSPVLPCTNPY